VRFLSLLVTLATLSGDTDLARHVTIHSVGGYIVRAPATLRLRVTVEPREDQRLLRVECVGEDFGRASELELRGDGGPRTSWVEWRDVPAGEYELRASVWTSTRLVASSRRTLQVW
jgi:hypothetical protein